MSRTAIASVRAWEAFDSRATPTVACEVRLAGGARATAAVPSGASTGRFEARELRDGGERFGGLGVRRAVENVQTGLAEAVAGLDASDTAAVDRALRQADGTPELRRLGANAVLAVSLAALLAAAGAEEVPLYRTLGREPLLPLPMINVLSGGAHAGGAVDVQDFLVVPVGSESFREALEWAWRVRTATAAIMEERGLRASLLADEGGFGPVLASNRAALELLAAGIARSGLEPGSEVAIAVDVAAGQLAAGSGYHLASELRTVSTGQLLDELESWCADHPIVSLEDPLSDDDWTGWAEASERFGDRVQLVGDDLFTTNAARLEHGIESGVANAILVKPNQAGTVTDAQAALLRAREAGYATIMSARSGDTEDAWLADLAVGWAAGQIKVGSLARSERTAKWNRLLAIEAELGDDARYAGRAALAR